LLLYVEGIGAGGFRLNTEDLCAAANHLQVEVNSR
jgi:hypothetical protein